MKKKTAVLLVVIAGLLMAAGLYARGDGGAASRWFAALHGQ